MRKTFFRKFIAVFVVAIMVLSVVPTVAFATETGTDSSSQGTNIVTAFEKFMKSLYDFVMNIINFFKNLGKPGGGAGSTAPKYDYKYYASLSDVLADLGAGTLGENAGAEAAAADIAVYEDENGAVNIVLLKDLALKETLVVASDVIINLNGCTISADGITAIAIADGNVVVDGTKEGSAVKVTNAGTAKAIEQTGGIVKLVGGAYSIDGGNGNAASVSVVAGEMTIESATITASGSNGATRAVQSTNDAYLKLDNSKVEATSDNNNAQGVYAAGKAEINNSEVYATAYLKSRALYIAATGDVVATDTEFVGMTSLLEKLKSNSQGILVSGGKAVINNCYAYGNHTGISNAGSLWVYGGTYESPGNGGMYFGNITAPAFIYDATIRWCAQREDANVPYGASPPDYNDAGLYIGGGSDRNNVVVYMDNCDITSNLWTLTLRGTSSEHDNILCISNSRIHGDGYIRVDNDTHRLFIGAGNNFTTDNVADLNRNPVAAGTVIVTNETYRY